MLTKNKEILKNLTILYIEDENNIRENMDRTLKLFAKKVHACPTAEKALEVIQNSCIDIVISDINLPGITGIELVKQIRSFDETIPIILLTAHMETEYLLDATKLKLVDYLIKPIDFTMLQEALEKATSELTKQGRYEVLFLNKTKYNLQKKELTCTANCETISLTHKEILLLEFLLEHKERVVYTDEVKDNIWEDAFEATDSALKNLLNKLRKKIGKESITNISGVGYRLILPEN